MYPFSEIFLNENRPIHERYLLLAQSLNLAPPILKTDFRNELEKGWPIEADTFVEIDPVLVRQ